MMEVHSNMIDIGRLFGLLFGSFCATFPRLRVYRVLFCHCFNQQGEQHQNALFDSLFKNVLFTITFMEAMCICTIQTIKRKDELCFVHLQELFNIEYETQIYNNRVPNHIHL